MTIMARRVASIPVRLASDTWVRIIKLVAPSNTDAREELMRVTGVASSLITREAMVDSPIVVAGDGPQIRLYCIYGEKAIEGDTVNEDALPNSPAESESWSMSLPCPADDLAWVQESLKQLSHHVTARELGESLSAESDDKTSQVAAGIDKKEFFRK